MIGSEAVRFFCKRGHAVIGVDNDELICNLAYPPLTSIVQGTEEIGRRAAELLLLGDFFSPLFHNIHNGDGCPCFTQRMGEGGYGGGG